ncbi:hypothetical protein HK100_001179 [Physocladia obscura]|uniref:FHA domain-containing protein n=1 Tax=Physocladia obscura TaxID=109957 RepID=A0AAD5SZ56_9FUNG|nr:hypothetical protein HK100_001179 [Physocladia obscura]
MRDFTDNENDDRSDAASIASTGTVNAPPVANANSNSKRGIYAPVLVMDSLASGAPFAQKRIDLTNTSQTNPLRIGRKVNAKSGPEPTNGIFDSKVLSRAHAEIFVDQDKVWIQDVKSSNGTFINGHRLSEEGVASTPHQLVSGDTVEFGIDIMNDDAQTVMYHKISSRIIIWDTSSQPTIPTSDSTQSTTSSSSGTPALTTRTNSSNIDWTSNQSNKKVGGLVKLDTAFAMLDSQIKTAAAASDQFTAVRNDMADIEALVSAITNSGNSDDIPIQEALRETVSARLSAKTTTVTNAVAPEVTATEIASLKADLALAKSKLAETSRSLKESRELSQPIYKDNEDLKKKRQEVEAQLLVVRRVSNEKIEKLEKELAEARKELETSKEREEEIIETALATTTAQKQHLGSLESELASAHATTALVEKMLATTEAELASEREKYLTELEAARKTAAKEILRVQDEASITDKDLKEKIAALEKESTIALEAKKRDIETATEKVKAERNAKADKAIEELKAKQKTEMKAVESQVQSLKKEIEMIKKSRNTEAEKLKKEVTEAGIKLKKSLDELAAAGKARDSAVVEASTSAARITSLTAQIATKEEEVKKVRDTARTSQSRNVVATTSRFSTTEKILENTKETSMNSPPFHDDDGEIVSLYTRSSISSSRTTGSELDRRNLPTRSSSLKIHSNPPSSSLGFTLNDGAAPPVPPMKQSKRDLAAKYDQDKLKVMEARRLYNLKLAAAAEEEKIKAAQRQEEELRRMREDTLRRQEEERLARKKAQVRQEQLSLLFSGGM